MPPKQWDSVRGDPWTDIDTLDMLLHRMTAGRLPFEDSAKASQFQTPKRADRSAVRLAAKPVQSDRGGNSENHCLSEGIVRGGKHG